MNIVQAGIDWFDGFQRRHPALGFPLAVLKKYGDDEAGHQAALLAYYGFLSIFPLLLVLTSVLKILIRHHDHLREVIINGATAYIPIAGSDLQNNINSVDGSGLALVVGIVLSFYGARGVADALRSGINHVWQVPYVRRSGFPRSIFKSLTMLLVGGAGLILAPLLSGYTLNVAGNGWLVRGLALLVSLAILFAMFLILVRIALPTHVPARDLRTAAALEAIGLTLLQSLGGYLLTHEIRHLQSLYSTFAIVLGLMFWLYLQAQVFFYTIEIASVRSLRLWPRAIDQQDLTPQDRRAFRFYARRNRFHPEEKIEVKTVSSDDDQR